MKSRLHIAFLLRCSIFGVPCSIFVFLAFFPALTQAQSTSLTLDACYALARENYPLVKQRELIAKTREYSIDNIAKGNLPQVIIAGQATYQSDVTTIPISVPGMDIPKISKDQYRLYGEINQPLTDMVTVSRQKELQETNSKIQEQNLEVELYKLRERINQLYFGALLIEEQQRQNDLLKKDIQTGIDRTQAAVTNGVDFKSNVDKLRAELLKADQRTIELKATRKAYLDMLTLFVNRPLNEQTVLTKPVTLTQAEDIRRPELRLFDYQKNGYMVQNKLISARNLPKFSLFFQGGVGQPSPVNMLSADLSSYYITGLRLNWSLTSFYTTSRERQLLTINQGMIDAQREAFVFNTQLTQKQQSADINRLQQLVNTDDEIITLRTSVKTAAQSQLTNGVITVNDFLREVNAEDQARQNKLLHETQLLMAQYSYQATTGIE
jgi:outer membrane protein TolC